MDAHNIFNMNNTDSAFTNTHVIETNFSFQNSSLPDLGFQDPIPYYGEHLKSFNRGYGVVHGYLSFIVCVFGITANFLNMIVLSRKDMISPTNAILTGLAVADLLVMFCFMPYTYNFHIRKHASVKEKFSYGWGVYTLFHAHFTVAVHTVAVWLTVLVAVWRFLAVSFPINSTIWFSMSRAKYAVISTYIICVVFCIPVYVTFTLSEVKLTTGEVAYRVQFSQLAERHDRLLEKINFWVYSVIAKLVPCVALTALSIGLIRALYNAQKINERLEIRKIESEAYHERITKMILVVLLLFLVTKFPSGILTLLCGILGRQFFQHVYLNFGEIMDVLALINNAINFIIYCSMSREFRDTFALLFIPKFIRKQKVHPTAETSETIVSTCV